MVSRPIGHFFGWARDGVARGLLRLGVRPNQVTVAGTVLTVGAGVAVAAGRAWWPAALLLVLGAGASDMLDGAVASLGGRRTRFGGVLDSVCDRLADAALFLGLALSYVRRPDAPPGTPPNLTLVLLAALGLVWAYLTSYVRARAEDEAIECRGGFWQRGERLVTILLGILFGHVATAVWVLGVWPVATVAHRLWCARRACRLMDEGRQVRPQDLEPRGALGLVLWRHPRGSLAFDVHAGLVIALLMALEYVCPLETFDPLGRWLAHP